MDDRLRPLWDFADLHATETRLRAQLDVETTDTARAEVLTQLARLEGLRGDFDGGDALIDEAASLGAGDLVARARIDLERGRLRRSSGNRDAAAPLFESAYAAAIETEHYFVAADAAHMVALVAPDRDGLVAWTNRGIELAEKHEAASYWAGPLLNNLGWEHYETGDLTAALAAFERALAVRLSDPQDADGIELARYAVGKTLRALGRPAEAVPQLEQAVESATSRDHEDGWFHEELAEEYAAIGRTDDARQQARLAIPLLERDDSSFADDAARRSRLRLLA